MCDFAPGERVVCIAPSPRGLTQVGVTYTVELVFAHPRGGAGLFLVGVENGAPFVGPFWGHNADRFRRAEPPKARDIEAWLDQPTKFEGPMRREKVAS